jgi:hypothetical protein
MVITDSIDAIVLNPKSKFNFDRIRKRRPYTKKFSCMAIEKMMIA